MSTTYMPELAIRSIVKHPKNPRHRAVADAGMVATVETSGILEPLIVAPAEGAAEKYVIIAGHRRLDAAKKAKLKSVPAMLRTDIQTEGQQIEAMCIENGHRQDLTPIEEAEAYQQLELLGYKDAAIAKAVGRDVKTVRARKKLLTLSADSQKRVHGGQLSLEKAIEIASFEPDVQARLEKEPAYNFDYALQRAKQDRKTHQKHAATVAELLAAGAVHVEVPKGGSVFTLTQADDDLTTTDRTFSADWADHKGCLGYAQYVDSYGTPQLHVLCTKASSHLKQLEAAEQERIARQHQEAETARLRGEALAAAATVGSESVLAMVSGLNISGALVDVIRTLLPFMLEQVASPGAVKRYQDLTGVPESARWDTWMYNDSNRSKFLLHVRDEISDATPSAVVHGLVALLVAQAETEANRPEPSAVAKPLLRGYVDYLLAIRHPMCDVDQELRQAIEAQPKADDTDDVEVA